MREYHGHEPGDTPGLLPGGTNWWEAGALFEQVRLLNYHGPKLTHYRWCNTGKLLALLMPHAFNNSVRFLTSDTAYNNTTKQALLFQVGLNNTYEPTNQTRVEVGFLT